MISCKLAGGLGNYMFQIATANTLAFKNNTIAKFNFSSAYQVHTNITYYADNIFRNVTNGDCELFYQYDEPSFSFNELPYKNGLLLNGYFQSERYLNRPLILKLFEPDLKHLKYINSKYNFNDMVSIHVRRGDYVNKQDKHPVQSLDYYNNAIEHFDNSKSFYILSDDIEWCKLHFKGKQFKFIENELDYIDLWIMNLCEHNIIANSSFSWWGAWLNKNPDKIVIAPKNWFGPNKKLDDRDLVPEKWIKI